MGPEVYIYIYVYTARPDGLPGIGDGPDHDENGESDLVNCSMGMLLFLILWTPR